MPDILNKINIKGVLQNYDLDGTTVNYYNTLTNTVIAMADERMYNFDGTTLNAIGLLKLKSLQSLPSKPTVRLVSLRKLAKSISNNNEEELAKVFGPE